MSSHPRAATEAAESLTPLELAILELLPDEGLRLGFAWLAPQPADIRKSLNAQLQDQPIEARVTKDQIQGALRRLTFRKFAVAKPLGSSRAGYQRTERGKREVS